MKLITYIMEDYKTEDSRRNTNCFYNEFNNEQFMQDIENLKIPNRANYQGYKFPTMFIIDFDDDNYDSTKVDAIFEGIANLNNAYTDCFTNNHFGTTVRMVYKDANGNIHNKPFTAQKTNSADYMYKISTKRIIQLMLDMHNNGKIKINNMTYIGYRFESIVKYSNLKFLKWENGFWRFSADSVKLSDINKTENVEILIEDVNDKVDGKSISDLGNSFVYEVKSEDVNLVPYGQSDFNIFDVQKIERLSCYNLFYGNAKRNNHILHGSFFYLYDKLIPRLVYSIDIGTNKVDIIFNDVNELTVNGITFYRDICDSLVRETYFECDGFEILDDYKGYVDEWKSRIDVSSIVNNFDLVDAKDATEFEMEFDSNLLELMFPKKIFYKGVEWERKDNQASRNTDSVGVYFKKVKYGDDELIVEVAIKKYDFELGVYPMQVYRFAKPNEILNCLTIDRETYNVNSGKYTLKELMTLILNSVDNDTTAINYIDNENYKSLPITVKNLKKYDNDIVSDEEIDAIKNEFLGNYINIDVINKIVSNLMLNIKRLIENELDYNELLKLSITNHTKLYMTIKEFLGGNIDDSVAKQIFEIYKRNNPNCPSIAIEGSPGIGKTRIAKKLAELYKKKIQVLSSSDLKAPYTGQTGYKIAEILYKASIFGDILLIDEAYNLQQDDFGREAIDMILPIMSGDRKSVIRRVKDENGESVDKEFKLENTPIIWFSGYSTELRKMISGNKGLYRRIEFLSLPTPSIDDLAILTAQNAIKIITGCDDNNYSNLCKRVFKLIFGIDYENVGGGYKNIKNNDSKLLNTIKNYYKWGTNKEYEEFFANYVGVEQLCISIFSLVDNDMTDDKIVNLIEEIIENKKDDIKKQLRAKLTIYTNFNFQIERDVKTTLSDVKGYKKEVANLRQVIDIISNKKIYNRKGIYLPKGILLVGKPGVGKTYIARATAGELKKVVEERSNKNISTAFIAVSAAELNQNEKITALFSEADNYDQLVIFVDEIDAIGKKREINENRTLLLELLKELDGFNERQNVFVIAATNEPDILDSALVRAGRFDRVIELGNIDKEGRVEIIKYYFDKLGFAKNESLSDTDVEKIIDVVEKETFSFVPAKIKQLFNATYLMYVELDNVAVEEWEILAMHRIKANITKESNAVDKFICDFKECVERDEIGEINKGKKEDSFSLSKNEGSSSTSIHEVGHAMISLSYGIMPFDKVTIVPRGDALGYVKPAKDESNLTKEKLLQRIRILLAGRVVEELFYGEGNVSLGASNDLERATRIAEDMVTVYGMSKKLGPMVIKNYDESYLGYSSTYTCSDSFRAEIESEIRDILKEEYENTKEYYKDKKDIVEKLARILFEKETMSGEEFKSEYDNIVGATH